MIDADCVMETYLEDEQAQLLQFLYACPVGLIEAHTNGTIGMINPFAMQLLLPIAKTDLVVSFFDIVEPFAPEIRNLVDVFPGRQGTVCDCLRIVIRPASLAQGIEARVLSCTLVKMSPKRLIITIADVSPQVAQERRLRQAETWFASLLDSVNDFTVISLNETGTIEGVSSSVMRQTGFSEADVLGKTLELFSPQNSQLERPTIQDQMAIASRDGWHLTEQAHRRPTGESYWCQRLIAVQGFSESPPGRQVSKYTVVLRDVQRQDSDADTLLQMLRKDHLTGSYSRAHFFEVAERECLRARRYGHPVALIAMDIDHFKHVNDTYGHAAGDAALRGFAQTCMTCLRPTDIFARIGGEEFVALLPSTDLHGAMELAERLRTSVHKLSVTVDGEVMNMTASFGCAEFSTEASTHVELLAAADQALYRGKRMGRDCVVSARQLATRAELP